LDNQKRIMAERMLEKGLDIVDIVDVTGLTEREILSIQDDKVEI